MLQVFFEPTSIFKTEQTLDNWQKQLTTNNQQLTTNN